MKDYTGKIIRITWTSNNHRDRYSVTGIVLNQSEKDDHIWLDIFKTNGEVCDLRYLSIANIEKVSAVRIDEALRRALEAYYKAKKAEIAFNEKVRKEQEEVRNRLNSCREAVKAASGEMNFSEFSAAVTALFNEKYPKHTEFHRNRSFRFSWASQTEFGVAHIQEIEKYVRPGDYSFIYQEYDCTLHIHEDKAYNEFCSKNAPAEIPALAKKAARMTLSASIGDKNFLTAERCYEFPLKYGYSKKSLEQIKEMLAR